MRRNSVRSRHDSDPDLKSAVFKKYVPLKEKTYTPIDLIGMGATSDVWLGRCSETQNEVVLKYPADDFKDDIRAHIIFEHEAHVLSHLDGCRGVVSLIDYQQVNDVPFLVLERLEGPTLHKTAFRSEKHAARFFSRLCDALAEIHGKGVVHRDIKPANIFVEAGPKMVDFAYSQLPINNPFAVRFEYPVGTASFMAPEQTYLRSRVDGRADIYSLGISMYYVMCRNPDCRYPFRPVNMGSSDEWYAVQRTIKPVPLHERDPSVSMQLSAIIQHALEKDPDKRYQHPLELKEELQRCLRQGSLF